MKIGNHLTRRKAEIFNGAEHVLNPGDELLVPKWTPHYGRCIAGTRTIHAFGGKRIQHD